MMVKLILMESTKKLVKLFLPVASFFFSTETTSHKNLPIVIQIGMKNVMNGMNNVLIGAELIYTVCILEYNDSIQRCEHSFWLISARNVQ